MPGERPGPSPEEIAGKKPPAPKPPEKPATPGAEKPSAAPREKAAPEKKKLKVGIIGLKGAVEQQARDVAEARLTAAQTELRGLRGVVKRVWKFNLFREYYRNKEIARVRQQIIETGNVFAGEAGREQHDTAVKSIVKRFVSEYDEAVHTEAGEKRGKIEEAVPAEQATLAKTEIRDLITAYAQGRLDKASFTEEKNRLLSRMHGAKEAEVPVRYADNLFDVADEVRKNLEAGASLESIDLDLDVTVGEAKLGVRTEANYNRLDRIIESVQRSRIGQFVNETTVASGISLAYSVTGGLAKRIATSRLAAAASFGGTALLAGGIAAAREKKLLEEERRLHARQMAKGGKFERHAERRRELEAVKIETVQARNLVDDLYATLYETRDGKRELKALDQAGFDEAARQLAEIEARVSTSDRQNLDLISYSDPAKVEQERFELDVLRAEAKVHLRRVLETGRVAGTLTTPSNRGFDEHLLNLEILKYHDLTHGEKGIEVKNRLFNSLRNKKAAGAFAKGVISGVVIGFTVQEATAFLREGQQGFFETLIKGRQPIAGRKLNLSALEYVRRWWADDLPGRIQPGKLHDVIIAGRKLQLPEGINLSRRPDGTFALVSGKDVILERLSFTKNGELSAGAKALLRKEGISFHDATSIARTVKEETIQVGTRKWFEKYPGETHAVKRVLWYDNDTPKPVFDKNELKLWWGGTHNTGLDTKGNYVFNIKHMRPDGSYHKTFSIDAQKALAEGKLKMLFSLSRDTQNQVFEVPIDSKGNAVIDPSSTIGKLFFKTVGGKAVFQGRYAEVAESLGSPAGAAERVRLLATHEGLGINEPLAPEPIFEKISRVITTRTPRTILDIPTDYQVEPPPVIPLYGRRPLERLREVPIGSHFYLPELANINEAKEFEKRRSKRLRENPQARLNHYQEITDYLDAQEPGHLAEVRDMAAEAGPMGKEVKAVVCIPVAGHQEGKQIYESLQNYTYQTANPEAYEIFLFVNHPDRDPQGRRVKPDETLKEIERFKKDYPQMNIKVAYRVIPAPQARIGQIRKLLNDAVLLRHHERGKKAADLIMISNDADNRGVAPQYLENFVKQYETNKNLDAMVGQLDWDPESYVRYPLIHTGVRLFQYVDVQARYGTGNIPSSGANFSFRSSAYAAVGGYRPEITLGEDVNLGRAVVHARGNWKTMGFAGARVSRLFTSSRRAIAALEEGHVPYDMWAREFSPFDAEVRNLGLGKGREPNLDDPSEIAELKKGLEWVINGTIRIMDRQAGRGASHRIYKRALGWMGIKYNLDAAGKIAITNMDHVVSKLKDYRQYGVILRDVKAGRTERLPELRATLERIRGENANEAEVGATV